ncbi:MAG: DUF1553 domain-containing protein [Pirellulales bacterium]|nr:DUF1553 domain-containing protein [Pirellulales bacterium]
MPILAQYCRWYPATCAVLWSAITLLVACPTYAEDALGKSADQPQSADQLIKYNRDIRPILVENCFACHGADSAARQAELRLDKREAAIQKGALSPGAPDKSALIERILSSDPEMVMPPPTTHKTLSPEQRELLRRWIADGAEYEPHWSYQTPRRPELPPVKNTSWPRNPIDHFILAQLEAAGLQPAPEADRRTLARRWSLDITGLPPDPADVEAFVNDNSADAAEKYVDRLMAQPEWGEHRARYWLDYARYADTHGIHFDNFREMWSYRDWMIKSFNDNKPFDQFTIENLAGDLLPNATLEQQIGSGFNRCNMTTNEGGAIDEEYLVLYARDRTDTTAQVWLGLTAGCAVCHDHKFDALAQKEFYALSAFFNNTTQRAMDGNIRDTPPIVPVPQSADRARWEQIGGEIDSARSAQVARREAARGDFNAWLDAAQPEELSAGIPRDKLQLHAPLAEGSGAKIQAVQNGETREHNLIEGATWSPGRANLSALKIAGQAPLSLADAGNFESDQPFSFGAWIKLPDIDVTSAVFARMDDGNGYRGWDLWIDNNRVGAHLVNSWAGDAIKVFSKAQLKKPREWQHVFVTYDGSKKAEGVKVYIDGQPQPIEIANNNLKSTIKTDVPLKLGQRHNSSRIENLALADVRLYDRELSATEVDSLAQAERVLPAVQKARDQRNEAETAELFAWWLQNQDAPSREIQTRIAALEKEQNEIKARSTIAHVMHEKPDMPKAHVLFRGDYDKRRDEVAAAVPAALPPFPADFPRNRLGLAKWLLLPEHPLTARVTVNRMWQEVFGLGLVRTTGDLGISGELPSHPELLDWLAVEFRESGWDMKKFYRMLLLSASYRQAALNTPEKLAKDPQNRLLSRGPRFRMDAEMVRDTALAASGLLVRKIGGPSVRPYQPEGVWEAVAMLESNTRNYQRDQGENLYRRSMYTFWKRAAPPASMEIFNAPNRETCAVKRDRTNTPLQALVTLNDTQFVEAARKLAEMALAQGGPTTEERLRFVALRLIGRPLSAAEQEILSRSLADFAAHYASAPADAAALLAVGESKSDPAFQAEELAAWTMTVNVLLNMDEALCK